MSSASPSGSAAAGPNPPAGAQPAWLMVRPAPSAFETWRRRLLWFALGVSVLFNIGMFSAWSEYYTNATPPVEQYHSGSRAAADKVAIIKIQGTIMPPFTERWLKQIERATKDDAVKAVLLEIDSPGGLVADSHQIYHKLRDLNAKKPVAVAMKRLAASGGYYVAMGAGMEGRIFAEPTTWTGSIGVIIPRYDLTQLADKVGVVSEPLKTGPLKDSLSPFRPLSEEDRAVWGEILNDALQRFEGVILEGRKNLDATKVKAVATGQIFTADQAKAKGLVDEIGYEEDAIAWLTDKAGLKTPRVIVYQASQSLLELALTSTMKSRSSSAVEMLLDSGVPRAYYHCSWAAGISAHELHDR